MSATFFEKELRSGMSSDVALALAAVRRLAEPTPLTHLPQLDLWIKDERHLPTGSFKLRGAAAWVSGTSSIGQVFTGSSGNHAAALAWVLSSTLGSRRLTAVVTKQSDPAKVQTLVRAGVRIVTVAGSNESRDRMARHLASEHEGQYCSSHDDPLVIAGQATVAVEILDAMPDTSTVVVPVGGGGLFAGTIQTAADLGGVRVVGAEPSGANAMALSLAANRLVRLPAADTRCDALRANEPGLRCFQIARGSGASVVVVSDQEVEHAQALLRGLIGHVELSAAAGVAAALKSRLAGAVCVVTGGPRRVSRTFNGASSSSTGDRV
ncbi:threonine dehydratase [Kribbella voronezhensis]|uniref:Threonine dehydratase n=1 Tax=Kribbella voronezhensis TaxID=2512212 RepID=A0A4V3FIW8_9ACTN|nr:pyridoxal-phosphate dependent enzyme [Kribbella voronezhensis]TDU84003.1 threonine dehydratase [Kribbella voronezhensis]